MSLTKQLLGHLMPVHLLGYLMPIQLPVHPHNHQYTCGTPVVPTRLLSSTTDPPCMQVHQASSIQPPAGTSGQQYSWPWPWPRKATAAFDQLHP